MKKILIFIDWYEPGYKAGGPIRSVKNLVEHLKEEAQLFIFTRDRDYGETDAYSQIPVDTWISTETNTNIFYCSPAGLKRSTLQQIIREQSYHKIYFNGIYSWYFSTLPLLLLRKDQKARAIVAARGMLARSAIGVKKGKKQLFLAMAKLIGLYKGITFHATGAQEKQDIQAQLGSDIAVKVAANLPVRSQVSVENTVLKTSGELRLVSVARISPEKNTYFGLEVLAACPADILVCLDLYGPVYDPIYWKKCEQLIAGLPSHVRVEYKGNLPNEQVSARLQQYHFFYLPSRGENFGHSILEAFSSGVPVITSDQTPWRALTERKLGYDLPLEPHIFIAAMAEAAAMDQAEYEDWSKSAINFAKKTSEDPATLNAYREMFGLNN